MKTVILAGGFGTRLSEETSIRPKPMVEIGNKPILWHIMKIYSAQGIHDFIICLGYKGEVIKDFFADYFLHNSDVTFDLQENRIEVHRRQAEPWRVTLVDTGENTMTGGRLKRVREYIGKETFCLTYGDGVSDVDIHRLIDFHRQEEAIVTLTAVQPPGRFGVFNLSEGQTKIYHFREKQKDDSAWINGGYFIMEPEVVDYLAGDETVLEQDPLQKLAHDGRLAAYRHYGYWQNMDTLRDKHILDDLWNRGNAPWKLWE